MIGFEFETPYIHEIPSEDGPPDRDCHDTANTYRWFGFDTPEAVLSYAPWRDKTIAPGRELGSTQKYPSRSN